VSTDIQDFPGMQTRPMNAWKRIKAVRFVPALRWIAHFTFAFGLGLIYAVANPTAATHASRSWLS
jgi:hypothetical protein